MKRKRVTGGVRDNSRVVSVSATQVQSTNPTFEVLSNTELCGFCHEPALSKDFDNISKLFQTLRNQFMSTSNENEREFFGDIHPFCPPCKKLATQLLECDELIKKTLEKAERIKIEFEKRVIDDILSDPEFQGATQLQLPEKQMRLVQLKNNIFENYRKKLRVEKLQKLRSRSNKIDGTTLSNTLVSSGNGLPSNHVRTRPKTGRDTSASYKGTYSSRVTLKERIPVTSNKRTQAAAGAQGRSFKKRRCGFNLSCIFCEKSYTSKRGLMQHLRAHAGEKPFNCCICNKEFGWKSTMMKHLRNHTGEKPYKCSVCKKRFNQISNLTAHSRTHTGERPFKCVICEKRFGQKGDLTEHIRIHTGEKPFKCIVCAKTFSKNAYLTEHSRIHTGEQPFKCGLCEKRFNQKSTLNIHSRIHTGEKQFDCKICGKAFVQKGNLRAHVRIHTGEQPFKCKVCFKTFRFNKSLTVHEKIHNTQL